MSLEQAIKENTEVLRELIAQLKEGNIGSASANKEATGEVIEKADQPEVKEEKATPTRSRRTRAQKEEADEPVSKYTAEQVKAAAVKVKDELGTRAAKDLIAKHGAPELAKLKPENYDAFVAEAEELLSGADDDDL